MRATTTALLALSVGLAACDYTETDGTPGEAGAGGFHYECLGWGDPVCTGEAPAELFDPLFDEASQQAIPPRIAVGAAFDVRFYDFDNETGVRGLERPVEPASDALLSSLVEGFVARSAGTVALIARDGRGGVADLVHVQLEDVVRIEIDGPATTLTIGDTADLFTRVFSEQNGRLGGALPHAWSVQGEGVVAIEHAYSTAEDALEDDDVVVRAIGAGTATITVEAGGVETTLDIRVDGGS